MIDLDRQRARPARPVVRARSSSSPAACCCWRSRSTRSRGAGGRSPDEHDGASAGPALHGADQPRAPRRRPRRRGRRGRRGGQSRSEARPRRTRPSTGSRRAHGSYEELLADPEVDAVYVPLPNSLHVPWSIARARGGQARAVREAADAARRRRSRRPSTRPSAPGRVLMEAFMWRHHPQARRLERARARGGRRRAAAGPRGVLASRCADDPGDVRLDAALDGGGADGRRLLLRERRCGCWRGEPARSSGEPVRRRRRAWTSASRGDAALRRRRARALRLRLRHGRAQPSSRWSGADGTLVRRRPVALARRRGIELRARGRDGEAVEVEAANPYALRARGFRRRRARRARARGSGARTRSARRARSRRSTARPPRAARSRV